MLEHLHVIEYPFLLWPSKNANFYITYNFLYLLPLFPGLSLAKLEIEDPFHGPDVAEDGWGDDATYHDIGDFITKSKGWQMLVFRSSSDTWMNPTKLTNICFGNGRTTEVHARDPQPETWDRMIKERDGVGSGARVEMFMKEAGEEKPWEKISGDYKPQVLDNPKDDIDVDDMAKRRSIEVRVRRGEGVDYRENGEKDVSGSYGEHLKTLYEIFEKDDWGKIKETLFIKGAEIDPTAHL